MKQFPTHIVAVDGVVENTAGEILLVHNRYSGLWTLPGGQVEAGETLTDALCREIREESGAEVCVGRLVCVTSNIGTYPGHHGYEMVPTKVMFEFVCAYLDGELHVSEETDDVRWIPRKEAAAYITSPPLAERFQSYLDGGEGVRYLAYVTKPDYILKAKRNI